ncbi:MAG: 3-isopropylmalate dehydratase large subunit [Gemmatimonadetes bacterium]|nr:3-isopropylmalate dehydratase large subunit [Gemmatimonadota bacterium]
MSSGKTVAEQILSARSGVDARAGDVVVCEVDWILGTDAATPMAIGYFEKMGGQSVRDPSRVMFALDHYSPPTTPRTKAFHDQVRAFARKHGIEVRDVGAGISHQLLLESGRAKAGDLVVGADSHTVTCGALGLFATGIGSSDLAAAMVTGQIWLRIPETIQVTLTGERAEGVSAKDMALALVAQVGGEGANYQAVEFRGPAAEALPLEDRLVLCNLAVEMSAKAAMFPVGPADPGARYARAVSLDLSALSPVVALPDAPANVTAIGNAAGTPVHMVFVGTCAGGRVSDIREVLRVIERAGGRVATGVQLVVTPASREVERKLTADGTLPRLASMGATITTPGCGACCGTSGVIPEDGMNVMSTANRNFRGRMGNPRASIYLASPAACAAAAVSGHITDPRTMGR